MAKESEFSADPAPQPVIRLREAELRFGRRVLWRDLDLDIAAGEFVAVLGPNGTGKTSLLKVLLGQNALTAGSARIEGKDTGDWVLVDTDDVVVHLFRPEVREFYQLEKMWMAPDALAELRRRQPHLLGAAAAPEGMTPTASTASA